MTIRDTVEIQKTSAATEFSFGQSLASGSPVAPFDGWAQIVYFDNLRLFGTELTSSDSLRLLVNGSSVSSDLLSNRYALAGKSLSDCGEGTDTLYNYNAIDSVDTWLPLQVNEGDTLDFEAIADTSVVGSVIYDQIDTNLWTASIQEACPTSAFRYRLDFGLVFVQESLTIDLSQAEVWPTLPPCPPKGCAHDRVPPVDNTIDLITVALSDGSSPLVGHSVNLKVAWVDTSNGHVHTGGLMSPPSGSLGMLKVLPDSSAVGSDVTGTTNSLGHALFKYVSSEIGGEFELVATATVGQDTLVARDTVTVSALGLKMLPWSQSQPVVWRKFGGTPKHPGPDDNNFPWDYEPDYNHWGRPEVDSALVFIATQWKNTHPTEAPLWINDMSLPMGGLFDVNGLWTLGSGHHLHRLGRDADVKTKRQGSGAGVLLDTTLVKPKNLSFEELVIASGGCPVPQIHSGGTPNEHYHLFFYPETEQKPCRH